MSTRKNPNSSSETIRFISELRARLIVSLMVLGFIFLPLLYFSNDLYTLLAYPLLKFLPQGHLIATEVVSSVFVPFKLSFMLALLLTIPFFLYQVWSFVAPALYGNERQLLWWFLFISICLFYLGTAFAYFVIFPALFHFVVGTTPLGVELSPDISAYFDFTIKLLLTFGGLFEIPMAMVLLVFAGIISHARLLAMRSYVIVSAFILGMLLAPPDVFSQIVVAIPIWLLYEAGLVMTRLVKNRHSRKR